MVNDAPDESELRARAARIRLVLTDCDGVLTDAGVYYSADGEAMKRFSFRDGMGIERLRDAGIETAIITRERSKIVERRAEKLRVRVYSGVMDKREHLDVIARETGQTVERIAYIGDDVNDLGIIKAVGEMGLTGAPVDAMDEVGSCVHFRSTQAGGYGAFRQFAEWILVLKGTGR